MPPKPLYFTVIILGESISLVTQFFASTLSVYFFEAPNLVFSQVDSSLLFFHYQNESNI